MINYETGDVKKMSLQKMKETIHSLGVVHSEIISELIERYGFERYAEYIRENDPTEFSDPLRLMKCKV